MKGGRKGEGKGRPLLLPRTGRMTAAGRESGPRQYDGAMNGIVVL